MEKENLLKNFENEYSLEISNGTVDVKTLKTLGLTDADLSAEAHLRTIFGDKFLEIDDADENQSGEKHIEKIDENDLSLNKGLTKEFESIETDEFNTAVETVLL